jgi:hypothetical protein
VKYSATPKTTAAINHAIHGMKASPVQIGYLESTSLEDGLSRRSGPSDALADVRADHMLYQLSHARRNERRQLNRRVVFGGRVCFCDVPGRQAEADDVELRSRSLSAGDTLINVGGFQ